MSQAQKQEFLFCKFLQQKNIIFYPNLSSVQLYPFTSLQRTMLQKPTVFSKRNPAFFLRLKTTFNAGSICYFQQCKKCNPFSPLFCKIHKPFLLDDIIVLIWLCVAFFSKFKIKIVHPKNWKNNKKMTSFQGKKFFCNIISD